MENSWYSKAELKNIGFKFCGSNVLISKKTSIYNPELMKFGNNIRVDDFCILSGNIELGDYVHIAAYTGLYGKYGIKFLPFGGVSGGCLVYSTTSDYSGHHLSSPMVPQEFRYSIGGPVIFEKHAFTGAGTIVMPNVILKEGSVTGAMCLVNKNLEPWSIYAGIPAKKIKDRDKELLNIESEIKN